MKIIFSLLLALLPATEAFAARQYRCGGRVQYRPCAQSEVRDSRMSQSAYQNLVRAEQNLVRGSLKYQKDMQGDSKHIYSEIVESSFRHLPNRKNTAQWRGIVRGNGDIHLNLLITRNGVVEINRYMGHIKLKDDQTIFNFVSTPPKGNDWTWQILSTPRAIN